VDATSGIVREVLWEKDSIIDLSARIVTNSSLQAINPMGINDRGEIVGKGVPSGCNSEDQCGHAFVLIPIPDDVGAATAAFQNDQVPDAKSPILATQDRTTTRKIVDELRARRPQRLRIPNIGAHTN
jgi:hypothetical protein